MFLGLAGAGAGAVAAWLYVLLGRGGFWLERDAGGAGAVPEAPPTVAAVIPARNEAGSVGRAVASLAGQRYAGALHIVLVDDASTDGTAEAGRAAAPTEMLTVMRAAPLPDGWTGKLWAVSQGIQACAGRRPDYVLLTDADIIHPPDNVAGLVARATSGGYDVVSYMATLECRSWAERALIPAFVFFFFMLYPPAWIRSRRRRTAGAAGGCLLIRREALERIGGIEAIRGELIDDCALARAVKRTGGTVWLGLSRETRSVRRYETLADVGGMISRTAFTQLDYSGARLGGTALALTAAYLLPPWLAVTQAARPAGVLGGAAWFLMSIAYSPILRYYRRSPLWAAFLPLTAAFYLGATVHSAVAYWRGSGGMWKGRAQARG